MDPRIHIVTLGVRDLPRAVRFYGEGLGWPRSSAGGDEIAFFRCGGAVLALFPRGALAEDAGVDPAGSGFSGITLAQNVAERERVAQVLEEAVAAGGTLIRPAEDVFWGGRRGYFADPDGYLWEVAWNPHFPFAPDGSLVLPE